MADEIEVSTEEDKKKDETPVSFVEDDGATLVTIGEEKKSEPSRADDERWRQAEANQARLANSFDDLRSRLVGGSGGQPHQAPTQADPWKTQEDAISDQERALGIQWEAHKAARSLTADLLKEFDQKSRDLQQRRIDLSTQRAIQSALPTLVAETARQSFRNQYSDVQGHQQANLYARGHFDMLRAQGHPDTAQTVDIAMNAARRAFGIGGARNQPTDRDRDQLTGFSGTRRTNVDNKNNTVKMGKSEKIMAMAMYGQAFNGDEKKVYSQWAKGPGIRAQKASAKARSTQR